MRGSCIFPIGWRVDEQDQGFNPHLFINIKNPADLSIYLADVEAMKDAPNWGSDWRDEVHKIFDDYTVLLRKIHSIRSEGITIEARDNGRERCLD